MLNAMSAFWAGQAGEVGTRLGQDTMSSLERVSALALDSDSRDLPSAGDLGQLPHSVSYL